MAETALTTTKAPGGYATTLTTVTMTVADVANGNSFVATSNDLVLVWNDSATPYTVTITSTLLSGRTGTIAAQAIGGDVHLIFGPMNVAGWQQTTGLIHVSASNASVKFGIINI